MCCYRYVSPTEAEIERAWHVGRKQPGRWWEEIVLPAKAAWGLYTTGRRRPTAGCRAWGPDPTVCQDAAAEIQHPQCPLRRAGRQAQLQTALGAWAALHYPGAVVRRAVPGDRPQCMVAFLSSPRPALGTCRAPSRQLGRLGAPHRHSRVANGSTTSMPVS